jgi:hypothetical protein
MTIKPRTIDNLGVETSIRYAHDKDQLDVRILDDSRWLPKKLEVSVTTPYVPSEFDQLFSADRINQWAFFTAPPNYGVQTRTLFSYQLIPSLGTYEKQEADMDKLAALKDVLDKHHRQKRDDSQNTDEEEQEEDERQMLLALFKCIETLDRALTFINARRNQYQRG